MSRIVRSFDKAAMRYDQVASVQREVAENLVAWAMPQAAPLEVCDLGCGTGFVSRAIAQRWPQTGITALDAAPQMLRAAQTKVPHLKLVPGDAGEIRMEPSFDLVFSSMMLHWLPDPGALIERWRNWLKPEGCLYLALLTEGSFQEWRDFCRIKGVEDGLWPMPKADFADPLVRRKKQECISVTHSSAFEFFQHLKRIGGSTPREGYKPLLPAKMRRLLESAPTPFTIAYRVLYLEIGTK